MSDSFHPYSQAVATLATRTPSPRDAAPNPAPSQENTEVIESSTSAPRVIIRLLVLAVAGWGLFHGWELLHPTPASSLPVTLTSASPVVMTPPVQRSAVVPSAAPSHSATIVGLTREPFAQAAQMAPLIDLGDDGVVGIWPGAQGLTNVAWKSITPTTCQALMQFFATHPAANQVTVIHINAQEGTAAACPLHGRIDVVLTPR